jgi:ribosomal protein S18 acetylase RimI-like enzyme
MNALSYVIQRATASDVDAVAELFDLYRQFYEQEPDPRKCRDYIKARISREESVIFVAYAAGGGIAQGFTQLYPTFCSVEATRMLVLYDLFVRQDIRSSGVGTALMKYAEEYARSCGASRIHLETHHSNIHAQRLYESLGYKKDIEFFHYALTL